MAESNSGGNGVDFELEEEEYGEDAEPIPESNSSQPNKWWSGVNEICNIGPFGGDESDGVRSESDLDSLCSDEDEQCTKNSRRDYNPASSQDVKLKLGMIFPSIEHFRHVLREVFIKEDREFKYLANDQIRVRAKCKGLGCKWLIYCRVQSLDQKSVRVNTLVDVHNCGVLFNNKLVNSTWLANHFLEQFRLHPHMEFKSFKEMCMSTKFSNVTSSMFYRARNLARNMLEGSVRDQYAVLEEYCKQLILTNPGTTALLKTALRSDGQRIFERVYICYNACKVGFNMGCRPLLAFDGCFLKGYCKGMLLATIGIDANNSQFPVAFAVVEKENTTTWTWFLTLLREDLSIDNTTRFTMMSDRQKGLEKSLSDIFPGAESRFCVRHLHANYKKKFPGLLLKQHLWLCARATTRVEFTKRMAALKAENKKAHDWLLGRDAKEWSKSEFRCNVKCDMLLNNLCESFNASILMARDKPIVTLLERIRYSLMCRFATRREAVHKWPHVVGHRIMAIIEKHKNVSRHCQATPAGNGKFQVMFHGSESFVVDLIARTCTCRLYELSGIPCPHALSCVWISGHDVLDYVDDWCRKDAYLAAYKSVIEPMTSPDKWPESGLNPILPPEEQLLPGRPKKKRNKSNDEPPPGFGPFPDHTNKHSRKGQINHCSKCKETGHTRKTCHNKSIVQLTAPNKRGRPKKSTPAPATVKRQQRREKQQATHT